MPVTRNTKTPNHLLLVVISIVFLAVAIAIITMIPCPSEPQFLFYKIVLAVSVAGIASIIPGFMRFKYKTVVSAGGALAVFVFVLTYNPAFITDNPRCRATFDLDVQLYGDSAKGVLITEGEVKVVVLGHTQFVPIQKEGRITLEDVPADIIGKPIYFIPQLEDYKKEQIPITLSNIVSSIDLILKPVNHTTLVKGSIYFKTAPLNKGTVNIEGISSVTDEFGNFSVEVPVKEGSPVNMKVLVDNKMVFNSTETASTARKEIYIK